MKRGIITTAGVIEPTLEGLNVKPTLTPEDIRFYLLYWDKIIMPANNLIDFAIPDEEDLIKCGAIWRPRVEHRGSFGGNEVAIAILNGQCEIAALMLKDTTTDYVIHQAGTQFTLPDKQCESRNTIRVDLAGALPVPGKDVPINEVLEFKERRADELGALHDALDEVYLEILKSPDPSLATKKSFTRLQTEIENLGQVSSEKYAVTSKFDLSTELNFSGKDMKDMVFAMAGGAAVGHFAGFTIPIATLFALASLIKISAKATKTFTPAGNNMKLAYLSRASNEGVLG